MGRVRENSAHAGCSLKLAPSSKMDLVTVEGHVSPTCQLGGGIEHLRRSGFCRSPLALLVDLLTQRVERVRPAISENSQRRHAHLVIGKGLVVHVVSI